MNDRPPFPSRPLKAYAIVAKGLLWLLMTAWLVLALGWGALHGWIVPKIGELRPDLEIEAGRVLGVPVRIGSIAARSEGLIPSFELSDVVLLDPQGRAALRLPRVIAALSPRSLWNLGFEQLFIDRPELDVRRAPDGKIFVAGLDFSRGGDNDGKGADWFFRQTEFVIRDGTVRWTDEMRGAPPLALENVDFVARNTGRSHAIRVDATPPSAWGERFTLRGLFHQPLLTTHRGRWQDWVGQVYADFSRVDVSQLRRYANLGIEISEGHGAVRAWADVSRGQLTGAAADLVLADVSTTLGRSLTPLALRSLSGRLGGKRLGEGFEFQTERLQFDTRDGQRWPGGNVFVSWQPSDGKRAAQGEFRADRLDLLAVSQIATHLPLGTATHAALTAYAPQGLVETLQAKWQGPVDNLQSYQAKGRAVRLEIAARAADTSASAPHAASPGLRGAAVDFDLTQAGGKGRVVMQKGAIEVPGVFEEPLVPVDELSADVQWQVDGPAISTTVSNLKFANADAQGEAKATWHTGDKGQPRFPGVLDLQGSLSRADGARVYRYLPLAVPRNAREYVHESVVQGTATGAKFRVRGNLREFPFRDGKSGEFRVTTDVRNVTYAYVPRSLVKGTATWPEMTQLSGELLFEGGGMSVKNAAGRFAGSPGLQFKADATIPDFRTTTVAVTGQVGGPLSQSLGVVNASPLASMTNGALARATGTGNADLRLKLDLPIATIDRSKVQGTVTLANNDVQITPDSPLLTRARGAVTFNERGFALVGTQARALGGDVRLEGGSRAAPAAPAGNDATVVLRAQGTATAEGLRQAREIGFVSRLAKDATGGAAYTMVMQVRRGVPEIAVTTNLQGLALNLPAPLAKTAESVLPIRYENALLRETPAAGSAPRMLDQLTVDVGRIASIAYVRDISGPEARVLRGVIGIGLPPNEAPAMPDQGVLANINLASVSVDAWEDVLGNAAIAGGTGSGGPRAQSGGASQAYLPTVLAVRAKDLTFGGRTLHNVVLGGSREGLTWRANVDAGELNGYIEYRQSSSGAGSGRLHARLARLSIAASAAREVETLLDEQPDNLPALDVVVDDFELKGKKLGKLEIDAVNRGATAVAREGGVREWRLNKLSLTVPEAVFSATGNWASINAQAGVPASAPVPARAGPRAAEQRRTVMNFKLDIADSGGLLTRFGMKDVVRRGRGKMEGQVAWLGSPLTLDYPSMNGNFFVNVEGGQFLKADPGLAKLLGVLSLQSLPRRLTLDFRDVFTEGFAFDFVRGDVTVQQGIAATNNLQMKGVNAAVLMEGKADLARETQDLKVVVVPEINAGTASLVAGVINPAIGLGTILAQLFLREPLIRAATQEFHIDGTWADPRVTKVDRKAQPGARADAASEPRVPKTN
ncbi:YhdP family protein [Caenimonas aquaedulcis]|uniref:TIGR02099 family protein n=1 Tax=Caenimonas aquaedulcis TaxID=2793270 RepID=A0A931H572_9BURK|nr:YhdP family protein [Caenimonas aquaedulcis]MBG9388854.1 TIGR02099 family protein [Caenimonas aquaedulcis]